jgi:methionyl-tRNA formyltransferase
MRLIFAGTPAFAAAALDALAEAGHDIALVLTQPDRPAGRGMKLTPSAVKQAAQARGLPVFQPTSLKPAEAQAALRAVAADVLVVAAYGLILPQAVLDIPKQRLPQHPCLAAAALARRGTDPALILEAGDAETGITIMQMEAGLDTGPMLLKTAVPIQDEDTAGSLHDTLARVGAASIVEALARLDEITPQAQDEALATYAAKLTKEEARLNWSQPAMELARAVRAYNPVPGAHTLLDGQMVKIWQATSLASNTSGGSPGEVLATGERGIVVACGEGTLNIAELQLAGGKRMTAAALVAGHALQPGRLFG